MTSNKKRGSGLKILALIAMLALAAGIFVLNRINYYKNFDEAFDPSDGSVVSFTIERGSGYNTIGRDLEAAGLIKDAKTFAYKTRLLGLGSKYQAGDFLLSPSMTLGEIMEELQDAKKETVRFTIPEGMCITEVAEKLASEGVISSAGEFYEALDSFDASGYWFMDGVKSEYPDPSGSVSAKANRFEGFLFPETYDVYADASASDVIKRMLDQFGKEFGTELQDKLKASGKDIKEIVTMASLIERETRDDSERPLIASVIVNRLKAGMPLQIDATQQYILGDPKALLSTEDTLIASPYNSYTNKGLPPGPIASPGIASIKAALEPADSDYLFYVLKSYGGDSHNFSASYEEFLKNKADYQKTIK